MDVPLHASTSYGLRYIPHHRDMLHNRSQYRTTFTGRQPQPHRFTTSQVRKFAALWCCDVTIGCELAIYDYDYDYELAQRCGVVNWLRTCDL